MRDFTRDARRQQDKQNMSDLIIDLKKARRDEFSRKKNKHVISKEYQK